MRQAVNTLSVSGGQGFVKCGCKKGDCGTQSHLCTCRRLGVLCNSKCHNFFIKFFINKI